jgi:hypothetical protein
VATLLPPFAVTKSTELGDVIFDVPDAPATVTEYVCPAVTGMIAAAAPPAPPPPPPDRLPLLLIELPDPPPPIVTTTMLLTPAGAVQFWVLLAVSASEYTGCTYPELTVPKIGMLLLKDA